MENTEFKQRSMFVETWKRLRKNKGAMIGLFIVVVLFLLAIFAGVIFDYDTDVIGQNYNELLQEPSWKHPFGTDEMGRDLLARIIYGSRASLFISFAAVCLAGIYHDIRSKPGCQRRFVIIALAISNIPIYCRLLRGSVMTQRGSEHIEAARAIGAKTSTIIWTHILPNCIAPVLVQFTLSIAVTILTISGLSFLGLGVAPPKPEWGALLSSSRSYMREHTYLTIFPGLAIMTTILSLNLLGDGLRDALDPRLR